MARKSRATRNLAEPGTRDFWWLMDFSKSKFLVVDDSAMVRDHIESLFKGLGANRIDKVSNGKEAFAKIKKAFGEAMPYALVTLDWEMPEMSGLELLKIIRSDPVMKSQLVLMVSSKSGPDDLRALAPLQPSGYIVKPFSAELLSERIRALLEAPT